MRYAVVFLTLAMMLLSITGIGYSEHVISSKENPELLYVLSAKTGSLEGDILTLNDIPLVIYFSDRPDRIAGHISLKKFVDAWNKGSDSFKSDPPNATLSVLKTVGANHVVVELMSAEHKNGSLVFKVVVLDGKVTHSFGTSSLFIDVTNQNNQGPVLN